MFTFPLCGLVFTVATTALKKKSKGKMESPVFSSHQSIHSSFSNLILDHFQ
jgi:hypothetical protein